MSSKISCMLRRLFYPKGLAVVGASSKAALTIQGNNYIKGSIVHQT